jgi:hypothetical protein
VKEAGESEDALTKAEIDSELAQDVQTALRSGNYPMPAGHDEAELHHHEDELN